MSKEIKELNEIDFFNEQILKSIKKKQETYFDDLCCSYNSHFKTDYSNSAINKHLLRNFVLLTYSFLISTEKPKYQNDYNEIVKITKTNRIYVSRDAMKQLLLKYDELRNIRNFLFSLNPKYSEFHYIKLHYKKNTSKTYYIIKLKVSNSEPNNELLNIFQQCLLKKSEFLEHLSSFPPIDVLKGMDSIQLVFSKKAYRDEFRKLLHQKPPANREGLANNIYYFAKSPSHYLGNITNFSSKKYDVAMKKEFYNTVISYYNSLISTDSTIK